jgi:hypothetical protein
MWKQGVAAYWWYCVDIGYFGGFVGSQFSSVAWEGVTFIAGN